MQWDVKSADMKYLATMAKNEGVPLTQKRKRNNKQSVLWGKCFRCCLGFNNEIIIDLHVTDLATHLNLLIGCSTMRFNANCTLNCVAILELLIG